MNSNFHNYPQAEINLFFQGIGPRISAWFAILVTTMLLHAGASAATVTWTGKGQKGNWDDGANWNSTDGKPPGPHDDVIIPENAGKITTTNETIAVKSLTIKDSQTPPVGQGPTEITSANAGGSLCIVTEDNVVIGPTIK